MSANPYLVGKVCEACGAEATCSEGEFRDTAPVPDAEGRLCETQEFTGVVHYWCLEHYESRRGTDE